jgi:hypothetical protein
MIRYAIHISTSSETCSSGPCTHNLQRRMISGLRPRLYPSTPNNPTNNLLEHNRTLAPRHHRQHHPPHCHLRPFFCAHRQQPRNPPEGPLSRPPAQGLETLLAILLHHTRRPCLVPRTARHTPLEGSESKDDALVGMSAGTRPPPRRIGVGIRIRRWRRRQ